MPVAASVQGLSEETAARQHSLGWACVAEEVALAAVTGTRVEGCLLPWVRSHMHGNFLSLVRGSVENLVVRKQM